MPEVKFHVSRESKGGGQYRHGIKLDTDSLVVKRGQAFDVKSTWHPQSIVQEVRFSGFEPLKEVAGKWVHDPVAKADWQAKRGLWRSFDPGSPDDHFPARTASLGGNSNRLVKFRITLVLQSGEEIFVDPIIDERP